MTRLTHWGRSGLLAIFLVLLPVALWAAPFAAYVMDARTGEVLYEKNADTRLHPASLTKMMTLYIAFQAIESGEVSLDTMVTVSANAAGQAPSRLGLRTGQKIALRYLIRAAAIKSANDAAAAIGDYLGGDEAHFAARMNRTAKALGMKNTTFKNANGLTRAGHLSTAHDMSLLGRHLLYDFPQYYGLFSRRTADAGIAHVANTNRRFLDAYEGADGIKTGYTVPAGFNLVASAQRGNKRIIATVFGGTSPAARNSKMAELLDLGFERAPSRVNGQKPQPPQLMANAAGDIAGPQVDGAQADSEEGDEAAVKLAAAAAGAATVAARATAPEEEVADASAAGLKRSPRPMARPAAAPAPEASPEPVAPTVQVAEATPAKRPADKPAIDPGADLVQVTAPQPETLAMIEPEATDEVEAQGDTDPSGPVFIQTATAQPETLAMGSAAQVPHNDTVILAALTPPAPMPEGKREVVARASSSGGRNWGISLGKYPSQYAAEQVLLKTALMESTALSQGLRKVATRKSGYDALFVGLTRGDAELACARLSARAVDCAVIGP